MAITIRPLSTLLKINRQGKNNPEDFDREACKAQYLNMSAKNDRSQNLNRKHCVDDVVSNLMQDRTRCRDQVKRARYYFSTYTKIYNELKNHKGPLLLKKKNSTVLIHSFQCLTTEESFDVLLNIHLLHKHIGLIKMREIVKKDYIISDFYIKILLKSCNVCRAIKQVTEKKNMSRSLPTKTVYLDIIDMPNRDGSFKYILVYFHKNTNFVFLRPIISKCDFEVATELVKIITSFGPPEVFSVAFKNKKFYAEVLENLGSLMLGLCCKITLTAYQKNVMPDLAHFGNYLFDWMEETGSANWGVGCHVVQWKFNNNKLGAIQIQKGNQDVAADDKKSPHSCVFGDLPP